MSALAALHAQGQGVARDYVKARQWYEKHSGPTKPPLPMAIRQPWSGSVLTIKSVGWVEGLRQGSGMVREGRSKGFPRGDVPSLVRFTRMAWVCPKTMTRQKNGTRRRR